MRLIDADALMREFAKFVRRSNNSDFADVPTWNDAVSLMGSAQTIDVDKLVRDYCIKRNLVIIPLEMFDKWQTRIMRVENERQDSTV